MQSNRVLIVGGGLAGLCCARQLQQAGIEWQLFEASDAVGGRVRTDMVGEFRLDRGFQVFLDSYPEAREVIDFNTIDLKPFQPGALIRYRGRFRKLADPWRHPLGFISTALNPAATFADKLLIAKLRQEVVDGPLSAQFTKPNGTTIDFLKSYGFSDLMIESFWRPFFGGIFLNRQLETSSRMLRFVFRMMSLGRACLPARGMQSIPASLAANLPPERIRLNSKVLSVREGEIVLASGESVSGQAIVVACEAPQTSQLLQGFGEASSQSVSCIYFVAEKSPLLQPVLVLNGESTGPINNLCVPTDVSPNYGPPAQSLVSVTVLEPFDDETLMIEAVLKQLRNWFGAQVDRWSHLRSYTISHALPSQPPAVLVEPSRPVRWQPWIYVCGDHRENASINGAMVSGRRGADAVLEDLRGQRLPNRQR